MNRLLIRLCLALAALTGAARAQYAVEAGDIHLSEVPEAFTVKVESRRPEPGVLEWTLTLTAPQPTVAPPVQASWSVPAVGMAGRWTTASDDLKLLYPNWSGRALVKSRAAREAPVLCLYGHGDENRLCMAASDGVNTVTLTAGVREEDGAMVCSLRLFDEAQPALTQYSVTLRLDWRSVRYDAALRDVAAWWAAMPMYQPAPVPRSARLPVYSSWYAFHQRLNVDSVLTECRLARALGCETLIVDDGWQTTDSGRGYAYTGDWRPERIPEMAAFVNAVHRLDMKFMLWVALPYMGEKAENGPHFSGKVLAHWPGKWGGSYTLDPRFPEVRAYLVERLVYMMKAWKLDGFKLDFIDEFVARPETDLTLADGRDYASVNAAVAALLAEIHDRLTAIRADVLIEFRQAYIGPLMRRFGNLFRADDCPASVHFNRLGFTDLRLLAAETPVHSDMLMWHADAPVADAALQLQHVLFSVPQISVRLSQLSSEHRAMTAFWLKYWRQHRHVLLDGAFEAHRPALLYPLLTSTTDSLCIAGVYDDFVIDLQTRQTSAVHVVNAKSSRQIVVKLPAHWRRYSVSSFDCLGRPEIQDRERPLQEVNIFDVPPSGLLQIRVAE